MTSVNTNAAALTALRTLQQTNSAMDATQNRISTGLKIGEAKDNAAYWSISTTLKSDNKSLATVKDSLSLGAATVDTAYEGLNSAKDVLDEITTLISSARQDGVDRTKIQAQISELQKQLKSNADSAVFSGENWLSVNSTNASLYSDNKSVVASFNRSATGAISLGTIDISIADVKLFDANENAATRGILDGRVTMTKADGTVTTDGGINAAGPSTVGLGFTAAASGAGAALVPEDGATVSLGTLNMAAITPGDRLSLNITVNSVTSAVHLATDGLTSANFHTQLAGAINTAFGSTVVTAQNDAGVIKLTTVATGTGANITINTNVTGSDGDGVTTGTLGLNGASGLPTHGTAASALVTAGTYAAATTANNDKLSFKFVYNNEVYQATHTYTGTTANEAALEAILQSAIDGAVRVSDGTSFATNHPPVSGTKAIIADVAAGANGITFETREKGFGVSLGIYDVQSENAAGVADATLDLGLTSSTAFVYDVNGAHTLTGSSPNTVAAGRATGATFAAGTFDSTAVEVGDTIKFNMNVGDGTTNNTHLIQVSTQGFTGTTATDRALFQQRLQDAVDAVFTATNEKVVVNIDTGSNAISFTHTPAAVASMGTASFIAITGVQGVDGNGVASSTGLTGTPSDIGGAGSPATKAVKTSATAFGAAMVFDADDTVSFNINLGSGATAVTINQANVQAALSGRSTIANAAELATVLNARFTTLGVAATAGETTLGSNTLKIEQTVGANSTVTITDVTSVGGGDTMSVSEIDLTHTRFTSLSSADQKTTIDAYLNVVDAARKKVVAAAADLGSAGKRIELQQTFVSTLMDTIDKGVGNLVDADMSEESTKLQALQVKQQLGVQALSIANQSAQQLLRLFQ